MSSVKVRSCPPEFPQPSPSPSGATKIAPFFEVLESVVGQSYPWFRRCPFGGRTATRVKHEDQPVGVVLVVVVGKPHVEAPAPIRQGVTADLPRTRDRKPAAGTETWLIPLASSPSFRPDGEHRGTGSTRLVRILPKLQRRGRAAPDTRHSGATRRGSARSARARRATTASPSVCRSATARTALARAAVACRAAGARASACGAAAARAATGHTSRARRCARTACGCCA